MPGTTYLRADLDHVAINVQGDQLELVDFYVSVMGFEPFRVEEFKAGTAVFPCVRLGATTLLEFFKPEDQAASPPRGLQQSNHICFTVEKAAFDSLLERLTEHGVEFADPPVKRSGARGSGWSTKLKDPEENEIEVRWYEGWKPE